MPLQVNWIMQCTYKQVFAQRIPDLTHDPQAPSYRVNIRKRQTSGPLGSPGIALRQRVAPTGAIFVWMVLGIPPPDLTCSGTMLTVEMEHGLCLKTYPNASPVFLTD